MDEETIIILFFALPNVAKASTIVTFASIFSLKSKCWYSNNGRGLAVNTTLDGIAYPG
jgi:hypothetical protein